MKAWLSMLILFYSVLTINQTVHLVMTHFLRKMLLPINLKNG